MIRVSHWIYQVSSVYPLISGRQARNLAVTLIMPVNLILLLFYILDQMSSKNDGLVLSNKADFHPKAKALGFQSENVIKNGGNRQNAYQRVASEINISATRKSMGVVIFRFA